MSFDSGRLLITVRDAQWKSQLESMASDYLRSLNDISPVKIEQLEFVVGALPPTAEE